MLGEWDAIKEIGNIHFGEDTSKERECFILFSNIWVTTMCRRNRIVLCCSRWKN